MTVWLVATEGERTPIATVCAFTTAEDAKRAARSYTWYMPREEDAAMVFPISGDGNGLTVAVHEHIRTFDLTAHISTEVLERKHAEELARQGETLLIEHLEEVLHDRKEVQR